MTKNKKNIQKHQVSFNMNDPDQKAMYDYVEKYPNVSAKYKRMILLEMQGLHDIQPMIIEEAKEEKEEKRISKFGLDSIL